MENIRSHKLHIALTKIPKKTLNLVLSNILVAPSIAHKAMRRLGLVFIKGPEIAFNNWKKFIEKDQILEVKKDFETKFKAMKIKGSMEKPARKVLRSAKSHADHDNTKLKMALKNLSVTVSKRNTDAIRLWHINALKSRLGGESSVVMSINRGLRLKEVLGILCRRVTRTASLRIHFNKDRVFKAIANLENHIKMRPKYAIAKWVKYAEKVTNNELLSNIKTLKLQKNLEMIVKKNIRTAYLIIAGDGDRV